jgi:hypothetical protein
MSSRLGFAKLLKQKSITHRSSVANLFDKMVLVLLLQL